MIETRLAWSPGTEVTETDDGRIHAASLRRKYATEPVSSAQKRAFAAVSGAGVPKASFLDSLRDEDAQCRMIMTRHQQELLRLGLIQEVLVHDAKPIVGIVSVSDRHRGGTTPAPASPALSRFALFRPLGDHIVIESPLSLVQIQIYDASVLTLANRLTQETVRAELAEPSELEIAILGVLAGANLLTERGAGGHTAEWADEGLRQWQFHDLYFHSRSRAGRTPEAVGGTFPFKGSLESPGALKPPMGSDVVALRKPDLEKVVGEDNSFTDVLERRRSLRTDREELLSVDQLAEFLFRAAGTRPVEASDGAAWRPSPSAGARHELEIYLAVNHCSDLPGGLYRYNPAEHQLERLEVDKENLDSIIDKAASAQAAESRPAVVIMMTARFQRVSWKYSAIAYSLILKNVGALMQTMYLVATSMNLAPCAVGTGDSDQFAALTGLNPFTEGLVGEFTLR